MIRLTRRASTLAACALAGCALAACATHPDTRTLSELRSVRADLTEYRVDDSLDRALQSYQRFLEETPVGALTPEAMRRLADLQIEREYGLIGDGSWLEMPAPGSRVPLPASRAPADARAERAGAAADGESVSESESEEDFVRRASAAAELEAFAAELDLPGLGGDGLQEAGPRAAIEIYRRLLAEYPYYERNDGVLYQMARAHDELGMTEEAIEVMGRLIEEHPHSRHIDEVQFRRGEYYFTRQMYLDAELAYSAILPLGAHTPYYELALYKLGWTFYKQELYEEALHEYMALLDHRLSTGFDFDEAYDEEEERRVADTFRVISLSFSNLGGPEVLQEYFAAQGRRSYEDSIYRNLGEFYLDKLRYQDAAAVYESFVELNPYHRIAPHFSMRVAEIYEQGGFPRLVVEAKKEFASSYGLQADYWRYFDVAEAHDVLAFLKTNLQDLAHHYHALYQEEALADEQPAHYAEAQLWYREYLASFPGDLETPGIHHQLADLLLEHGDFGQAAREYERTAYDYEPHGQAAAAGYAAVYAHRENLRLAMPEQAERVKRETVASSLRFADTFPAHEHAPVVLSAAIDDLYAMREHRAAIDSARTLIERYPAADRELRRSAWLVVAHSSFELEDHPVAEDAYALTIELTPHDDESRDELFDNLAASIYQQGDAANQAGDYRAAADHFLRIRERAPGSTVRPAAEYDAAAALMRLEDWARAAEVLQAFRREFPSHELQRDATRQIAFAYREDGQLARAAEEYERVSSEAEDAEMRREALLLAGELYEEAERDERALDVYLRYVEAFPEPLEMNVEMRYKVAGMFQDRGEIERYHRELRHVVDTDRTAGAARTDRTRFLAARSALVLAQPLYEQFAAVRLVQPFEVSLATKQNRMDAALAAFEELVGYQVGEVTAAATYYIAEIYYGFSVALHESERPADLSAAELMTYELVIEEEAFPFEEQAIDVHEKNLELMTAGIYNRWIEDSLDRLADLMPGRYAKHEISTGFVGSIESYAYRSPNAPPDLVDGIDGMDADADAGAQSRERAAPPDPARDRDPARTAPMPDVLVTGAGHASLR